MEVSHKCFLTSRCNCPEPAPIWLEILIVWLHSEPHDSLFYVYWTSGLCADRRVIIPMVSLPFPAQNGVASASILSLMIMGKRLWCENLRDFFLFFQDDAGKHAIASVCMCVGGYLLSTETHSSLFWNLRSSDKEVQFLFHRCIPTLCHSLVEKTSKDFPGLTIS